jgi:hypothetical protein
MSNIDISWWFWIGVYFFLLFGGYCYGLGSGQGFKEAWKRKPKRIIGYEDMGQMYQHPIYEKQEPENKWGFFIAWSFLGILCLVSYILGWAVRGFK